MANYITISRIFLILPILYLVSDQNAGSNWAALVLFIIAGMTDHFDGYIARKTGTASPLGALLDLIADKLLICVPMIFLLSLSDKNDLLFPAMVIISRELIVSSLRQFLAESLGTNPIKVSLIAKSKTMTQIVALSFFMISPNFNETFYLLTQLLFWVAAYISVHSLYDYLKTYKNNFK